MHPKKLPRGLRSTTPARVGGGSVPLRSAPLRSVPSPFRYAMAARVLRSVPRARRHYTRARARCAAARPRPSPLGVTFRESGGITRFARYTAALAPLHAKRGAPPPPPPRANCSAVLRRLRGGAASLHSTPTTLRYTPPTLRSTTTPLRLHYDNAVSKSKKKRWRVWRNEKIEGASRGGARSLLFLQE